MSDEALSIFALGASRDFAEVDRRVVAAFEARHFQRNQVRMARDGKRASR